MNDEEKICPILSIGSEKGTQLCILDSCALYDDTHQLCALKNLGALSGIYEIMEKME